jgi:hypothetical protein
VEAFGRRTAMRAKRQKPAEKPKTLTKRVEALERKFKWLTEYIDAHGGGRTTWSQANPDKKKKLYFI